MKIRTVKKDELNDVWELVKTYVDESIEKEEIEKYYILFPRMFVGCYKGKELIGVCIPSLFGNELYLKAICVRKEYWRKGIGSSLLKVFEKRVKEYNFEEITIPSADIWWVEQFYLKNGYLPYQIRVKVKKDKLKMRNIKREVVIVGEREDESFKYFYVKVEVYSPLIRKRIKEMFRAEEAIYLFRKRIL